MEADLLDDAIRVSPVFDVPALIRPAVTAAGRLRASYCVLHLELERTGPAGRTTAPDAVKPRVAQVLETSIRRARDARIAGLRGDAASLAIVAGTDDTRGMRTLRERLEAVLASRLTVDPSQRRVSVRGRLFGPTAALRALALPEAVQRSARQIARWVESCSANEAPGGGS